MGLEEPVEECMGNRREMREVRELVDAALRLHRNILVPGLEVSARSQAGELQKLLPEPFTEQPLDSWLAQLVREASGSWIAVGLLLRLTEDFGLAPYPHRQPGDAEQRNEHDTQVVEWLRRLATLLFPSAHPVALLALPESALKALLDLFREEAGGAPRWRGALRAPAVMAELFNGLAGNDAAHPVLLATPDFISDFLAERTLGPAASEFGVETLRILDPACGSGLLLGSAFRKLLELRGRGSSRVEAAVAWDVLEQLHGVDISPLAYAWTRCTLLRALLQSVLSPERVGLWARPLNVSLGNALLEYACIPTSRLARQRYHVVLVEPPFITERSPALREVYRAHFVSASHAFSLVAPFVELAFGVAAENGFVSALLSNSFTKRAFGRSLVEHVIAHQDLACVIDTSGAYIPGHATPTMMLFARRRPPSSNPVRTVTSRRGEPITPSDPGLGRVWTELQGHIDTPGFEGAFVSVADRPREAFARHPWAVLPSRLMDAMALLERESSIRLGEVARRITRTRAPFADILAGPDALLRHHVPRTAMRMLIQASELADWSLGWDGALAIPDPTQVDALSGGSLLFRGLGGLASFMGPFMGSPDDELRGAVEHLFSTGLTGPEPREILGVATVARQNHFHRIQSGGFVSTSVSRLELAWSHAEEEKTLALLAYLNSSTAWFWLQNLSFTKVLREFEGQYRRDLDARHMLFEVSSETLVRLPVPKALLEQGAVRQRLAASARRLEQLARKHRGCDPRFVLGTLEEPGPPDSSPEHRWDGKSRTSLLRALAWARHDEELLFREMVVQQEEIDWLVYSALGLARIEPLPQGGRALPEQRPFAWLKEEAPPGVPSGLVAEWEARRRQRASNALLQVFDAEACKRWWTTRRKVGDHDRRRVHEACERWLLARAEQVFGMQRSPTPLAVGQLAEALCSEPEVTAVMQVLASTPSPDLAAFLRSLLPGESVPFLVEWRLSSHGLAKHEGWRRLWELQHSRPVTLGEAQRLAVPYEARDFRRPSYWRLRGRLDFPRERFISYPGAGSDATELLYGWAGWTLPQQAEVLQGLYRGGRKDSWTADRLLPILRGLEELLPWIRFSHEGVASRLEEFLERARGEMGVDQQWR